MRHDWVDTKPLRLNHCEHGMLGAYTRSYVVKKFGDNGFTGIKTLWITGSHLFRPQMMLISCVEQGEQHTGIDQRA